MAENEVGVSDGVEAGEVGAGDGVRDMDDDIAVNTAGKIQGRWLYKNNIHLGRLLLCTGCQAIIPSYLS